MFEALDQLFNALTRLFKATERIAITIDNVCAVGEQRSAAFLTEQGTQLAVRQALADKEAQRLLAE